MDGDECEVDQREEPVYIGGRRVRDQKRLRVSEEPLGALPNGLAPGSRQLEIWRLGQRSGGEGRPHHPFSLGSVGQPVLAEPNSRLPFRTVPCPLEERQDRLPGLLGDLLAQFDRLRQDYLFLRRQKGDAADLAQVHPDRVVEPDNVGRERLEFLRRRLLY